MKNIKHSERQVSDEFRPWSSCFFPSAFGINPPGGFRASRGALLVSLRIKGYRRAGWIDCEDSERQNLESDPFLQGSWRTSQLPEKNKSTARCEF